MKLCLIAIAVAGMGSAASAQNLQISVLSRIGDSGTWAAWTDAVIGQTVQVGIFMSGDGVYGLGGATLRLTGVGSGPGMVATFAEGTSTGRVGPFNFGAATNQIFSTADGFRIDAASDAANNNSNAGLTFFQRDPASAGATFSTANPALVFRFDVRITVPGSGPLTMILDQLSRDVGSYYATANDTRPSTSAVTLNAGTIFVPSPGVPLIAGVGLAAMVRRRRR